MQFIIHHFGVDQVADLFEFNLQPFKHAIFTSSRSPNCPLQPPKPTTVHPSVPPTVPGAGLPCVGRQRGLQRLGRQRRQRRERRELRRGLHRDEVQAEEHRPTGGSTELRRKHAGTGSIRTLNL